MMDSILFNRDKKWKAAQSNRLRNRNFHRKRKVIDANYGVTNAKKELLSTEESVVESAPENTSSFSSIDRNDSAGLSSADSSNSSSTFSSDSSVLQSEVENEQDSHINISAWQDDGTMLNSSSNNEEIRRPQVQNKIDGQPHTVPESEPDIVTVVKQYARSYALPYAYVDGLLKTLKPFHPDLPLSSKTLMGPHTTNCIEYFPSNREDVKAEYVYFSITDSLQEIVNPIFHPDRRLRLQFFFDGLTLFNSSKIEFWPILGKVYTDENIYQPFVVAIHCGVGKPKCVHQYLWKFVVEINSLLSNGICVENEHYTVELMSFVADTLARAYVKCCKGHTGFHACERCNTVGFKVDGTTIFPVFEEILRTDASFRSQEDPLHHNGVSPLLLINPAIDIIKLFILDFMHLVCLGVTKKLISDYWVHPSLKFLSRENMMRLCLRLTNLSTQIPSDFQRTTRSLSDVSSWKATEFRFFLLYSGMFVLKDILPEDKYNHFMLLSIGCRILCSKKFYKVYLPQARQYLKTFVKTSVSPELYGPKFLVINNHNLSHLADDVENLDCPAMDYSAFHFESFLGRLKNLVESGNKPLAQVCNKIQDYMGCERAVKKPDFEIKRQIKTRKGKFLYKKVRFLNCDISLDGVNNVVSLNSGEIIRITSMTSDSKDSAPNQIIVRGTRVILVGPAFMYPCDSTLLDIHRVIEDEIQSKETTLESVACKWILLKIFEVPGDPVISYAMPLLHMN